MGAGRRQLKTLITVMIFAASLSACKKETVTVEFNTEGGKSVPTPKLADREKCYGIAPAQYNDGTAGCDDCAGTARKDFMPNTWKYVPQGTCEAAGGTAIPGKPWPE